MMQQQPPSAASNPSPPLPFNPSTVTTEQIQKYLDENKNLIMAILENQSLGKLAECHQYQAILQRNLMYLAAIADAQPPQTSAAPSQPPPSSGAQQGNHQQQPQTLMPQQQPQTLMPQQQHGLPVAKLPFQLNALRPQDQQQQVMHLQSPQQYLGQAGSNNPMHQSAQPGHSNLASFMVGRGGRQNPLEANSSDIQGK